MVDIQGHSSINNSITTGALKIESIPVKKNFFFWLCLSGNPRISGPFPPNIIQIQWLWWLWFTGESTDCQVVCVLGDFRVGGYCCTSLLKAKGLLKHYSKSVTVQSPLSHQVCFALQTSYLGRFIPFLAWPVWFIWNITTQPTRFTLRLGLKSSRHRHQKVGSLEWPGREERGMDGSGKS